jgi:thioredoxin 1
MGHWIRSNAERFALVGVALVIAGISVGAAVNTNPVELRPQGRADAVPQKKGQEKMLTATKQGKVHHADDSNFDEVVLMSDVPVLVDFYADWCGPCRMLSPVLQELARETSDAKIVKVNVDHSPQAAARYGVNAIPSLKVFKDGEVVSEHVGLARKADLKQMLGS